MFTGGSSDQNQNPTNYCEQADGYSGGGEACYQTTPPPSQVKTWREPELRGLRKSRGFSLDSVAQDYRETEYRLTRLRRALDTLTKNTSETQNAEFVMMLRDLRDLGYDC